MNKKKILFVYPNMKVGGSTTALLSLLKNLGPDKYEIDIQLLNNAGPLIEYIPEYVNLLPEALKHNGRLSHLGRIVTYIVKGYFWEALFRVLRSSNKKWFKTYFSECIAREFSVKNQTQYDYAVSFIEGWSNRYIAYNTKASKKYGWIHSMFSKTTDNSLGEVGWIEKLDKIVFVSPECKAEFDKMMPAYSNKSVFLENITDSSFVKQRASEFTENDIQYERFIAHTGLKLVTVCRLHLETKGLDRLVSCAGKLKSDGVKFLWYIIGEGKDRERVSNLINESGLENEVILIGEKLNPFPYVKAADLSCLLSRYEGKPLIVTESMILGTPVFVTEYMSARNQIDNGINGFITPNSDQVADAFGDFVKNADVIEKIKHNLNNSEYGNKKYISVIEKELFFS